MRYLIDTHVLLWWLDDNVSLSSIAKDTISNPNNVIFLSAVSTWEIAIKKALGKLVAPDNLENVILDCNFTPLPVTIKHTLYLENIDNHHDDPFDRLLISQAITENLVFITRDNKIQQYQIPIIKA